MIKLFYSYGINSVRGFHFITMSDSIMVNQLIMRSPVQEQWIHYTHNYLSWKACDDSFAHVQHCACHTQSHESAGRNVHAFKFVASQRLYAWMMHNLTSRLVEALKWSSKPDNTSFKVLVSTPGLSSSNGGWPKFIDSSCSFFPQNFL
jgi:hypothetical protein